MTAGLKGSCVDTTWNPSHFLTTGWITDVQDLEEEFSFLYNKALEAVCSCNM